MNSQRARVIPLFFKRDLIHCTRNLKECPRVHLHSIPKYKNTIISQPGTFLHHSDCPPKCWQCEFPHKSELFCSKCKALQKMPKDLNFFDIIGVKNEFDITIEDVQRKYRQLQNLLHPDRFGQKSEKEKKISEDLSSLVNKAYNTLLHPLDRGLYMLKLHNMTISEETTSLDPEFLMEVMERNEEVEEAADNKDKALKLLKENREILATLTKQISEAFHNEDIESAKKLLTKMKYYISIENRLKKLKQDLCIVE